MLVLGHNEIMFVGAEGGGKKERGRERKGGRKLT